MTRARIVLVGSNDTHVRMFAPVIDALSAGGTDAVLLALDAHYGQGAAAAARAAGLRPVELSRAGGPLPGGAFYRRAAPAVWLDVLRARPVMRATLTAIGPDVVVVGNDRGLLEKLALAEGRRVGARTVLVQDGRLAPRPEPASLLERLRRSARAAVSRCLRVVGYGFLGASEYGGSGVDVICASGRAGASILEARAAARSRVIVTGQPRYDRVPGPGPVAARPWDAVMFTTPFAHAGLGRTYQARQLAVAAAMGRWAAAQERRIAVKPHPREDPGEYVRAIGASNVLDGAPRDLLAQAAVAIVGMSTLIEEAAMLECPVVVPGSVIHGREFDDVLPPDPVYPRCNTLEELESWVDRLREPSTRASVLDAQVAHVDGEVDWRSGVPAAQRVAAAILGP